MQEDALLMATKHVQHIDHYKSKQFKSIRQFGRDDSSSE